MADLNRRVEVLVGVFTLLGAGGFLVAVALSLWGDELRPRTSYELVLESGAGLGAGTPVTISGVKVGTVDAVELAPGRQVRLELSVLERYAAEVREGSVGEATITLEGRVVEIGPGPDDAPVLADGGQLVSGGTYDPVAAFQELELLPTLKSVQRILQDVERLAGEVAIGDGQLPELAEQLTVLAKKVAAGEGTVGRLLADEQLLVQTLSTMEKVDQLVGNVDALTGQLSVTLVQLEETNNAILATARQTQSTLVAVEGSTTALDAALKPMPGTLRQVDGALREFDTTLQAMQDLPLMRKRTE